MVVSSWRDGNMRAIELDMHARTTYKSSDTSDNLARNFLMKSLSRCSYGLIMLQQYTSLIIVCIIVVWNDCIRG